MTDPHGPSISEEWASFAASLKFSELPPEVRKMVGSLVRDQLVCQAVGAGIPHNAIVREYALEESTPGEATVVRGGRGARAEGAALANATAGHGFEMDDTHFRALSHPSCVVVPATLAVAEHLDRRGQETLVALALGIELAIRIGLSVMPSMLNSRGFHETAVMGVFGAAVAAGRLAALEPGQLTAALGIAGSHASGTIEYARSGGEVKRLHAGIGAAAGIRSARLAELGLTAPRRIFEGTKGIFGAVAEEVEPGFMLADLGDTWHLLDLCPKEFSAAATVHGPVRALRCILSENRLEAGDIKRLRVGVDEFSAGHLGTLGSRPADVAGAQFSLHYSLGMTAVLDGNSHREYMRATGDGFADPEILRIADLVEVTVDQAASEVFPERLMGAVTVETISGDTYSARDEALTFWDHDFVESRFDEVIGEEFGADVARRLRRDTEAFAEDGAVRGSLDGLRQVRSGA